MVSSLHKRRAIEDVLKQGMCSVRRACQWLGLSRSAYYRQPKSKSELEELLLKRMLELSYQHPVYGYRFITNLLRREGWLVSYKKIQRLRRKEGLNSRVYAPKKRRKGRSTCEVQQANSVNDVWCWDFIHDVSEDGRSIRILSIVDEYSRFCIELRPRRRSFRAKDVIHALEKALKCYGLPSHIRSDNGPEFIAKDIQKWLESRSIKTKYIQPGSPWQNPYVESFHSRFRTECLNREWFINLLDARVCIEDFQNQYNTVRPHSSIQYKSPIELYQPQGFDSARATPLLHQNLANSHQALPILT